MLLARQFAFDGTLLAKAIAVTFANRETRIDVAPILKGTCIAGSSEVRSA